MRRDVGHSKLAAAGILAVGVIGLAAGCSSSTVAGSGSPARAVADQQSATRHQTPVRKSPEHAPAKPAPRASRAHRPRVHKPPAQKPPAQPTRAAPPPTHEPPPSAPPAPQAADGRNLAACREATCEVELVAGDQIALDPALGLDQMTVKAVSTQISFGLSGHGQGLNLVGRDVSSGTSCTNGACTTTGSLSLTPGMTGQINQIHITLTELNGGHAIVTMRPS